MRRLRIGVLFGGRSTEHEVSILSAQSIIAAMDPDRFEPVPLYIDKAGRWLIGGSLKRLSDDTARKYVYLPPDPTQRSLVPAQDGNSLGGSLPPLDAVFPVFHGLNGEDGTIQGVLELANIPYVGAGVLGSALGLDKIYMKRAFAAVGLPIVDYLSITRRQYEQDPGAFVALIEARLGYPCFTKFANSGSSVGTTKAHDRAELIEGMRLASTFDRKLLVERAVDARELECAVLGNDEPEASVVGEVVPAHEFYDYEAKYLIEGSKLLIPAPVPDEVADQIRRYAVDAFKAIGCAGMARVDFFWDGEQVLLNEINTIPGF